jgi:hypothetical protein
MRTRGEPRPQPAPVLHPPLTEGRSRAELHGSDGGVYRASTGDWNVVFQHKAEPET